MKRSTRVLAIVGAVLALLLVLLLVLPFLFRDRIAARAKTAVNQNLNARVDWNNVGLSFFRHFPNLTLTLDGLTAVGVDRFQGDTLAAVRHLRVSLSLPSVLRNVMGGSGPVVVRAIELDQPRLSLIALEDGTANWDITRKAAQPEPSAAKPVAVSLRRFEIEDGDIAFDNRRSKLKATLRGYDQSLSGDFSQRNVAVQTRASADTASVTFAGIAYLNRVKLGLTADAEADLAEKTYVLKDTELSLNDLKLAVAGSARSIGESLGLDLAFRAPSTSFRSILSLVPAVYARDFDKVKTAGSFTVKGRVKGEYGDSAFPAFTLNAEVNDAAFQYPDLPLPARSIFLDLALTNPGGSPDSTVVRLDRFHLRIGRNPVDVAMVLRTPVSDPNVDLKVKGKLDLADVRRTIKLEGIDQLTGTVAADAAVRTRMSDIDNKRYDRVAASGSVDVGDLTLEGKTLPLPLAIQQASLRLRPERAELTSFTGTIGSSDLRASGSLDNLISYAFRDDTLRGTATVRSRRFNLDEWRSGESDLQIIPVPANIDFALNATVDQLTFDKLEMKDARGKLRIKDQRVTLEDFRMNTLGGQIAVTGYYETTNPAKPAFDVGFKMTKVNIPSAFQAFTTVQMLAPVAKYASGQVTTDLRLNGDLGKNMMPLFSALSGRGTLQTSNVALRNFPGMEKIVDVTKLQILNNPTMQAIRTAFQIQEGRLVLQPFDVKLGGLTMNVAGSNGIDQSLEYTLKLQVPRSLLGGEANRAISGLMSRAGQAGVDLSAAPVVPLGIQLGGTVTDPAVKVDVGSVATSVAQGAQQAVKQAVTEKVDSAAMRAVQAAERQAAAIRQQAESLAASVKQAGYQQADALTAEAGSNPLLKAGAEVAADQLRKETDDKVKGIVGEAGRRADSLVAAARRQAEGR
ncbi:MAG TPA: AsmA-like C-terminal region-containing protein [Gemmatimonadales bacterium]|nr:AsmA-like C-terminal region-containing protein [Gemmatimonadales bacterium]